MAEKHLKSEVYYNDLYDRHTVDICRRLIENNNKKIKGLDPKNPKSKFEEAMFKMLSELRLYWEKGERYLEKSETVRKWMQKDQAKDDLLESAIPPDGITCLSCGTVMRPDSGTIHDWSEDKKERVLFMYDCPNKCSPVRAFFNDGKEYRPGPILCPKCRGSDLKFTKEKSEHKIIIHYSCNSCGHKYDNEYDFTPKKEEIDENFSKDRDLYCLTEKQGQEYLGGKASLISVTGFMNEYKKKEEHKEELSKIKKLTVIDLEKLIIPIMEKWGYIQLKLGNPEIGKDVVIPFTVNDSKSDREKMASEQDLKHNLKKVLQDTNWRLMSDGVSYRLGILSGRLKGYETDEDLLKLINNK